MIEKFIEILQLHFIPLGGFGLFLASLMGEMMLIVPSPLIMMTGGFLFLHGQWSLVLFGTLLWKISIPIALGATLGSLFIYYVAFFGGKPTVLYYGKWFGLSWKELEHAEKQFEKGYAEGLVIFSVAAIPLVPLIFLGAVCGILRVPMKNYFGYAFLGMVIRTSIFGTLGWALGKFYIRYVHFVDHFEKFILVILCGIFAFILIRRYHTIRNSKTLEDML